MLDAPRRELQEFMVEQREAGMLLTMASKNNEQDVLDTFAAHPEMPLACDTSLAGAGTGSRRRKTSSRSRRTRSWAG